MAEIFTQEGVQAILAEVRDKARARIFEGSTQKPFQVQKIVLDLSTARLETDPFQINFAFRSFYVEDATDVNVNAFLKPTTRDSVQSFFKIKKNDSWASDFPISSAYLHWDAQSSKSITIVFFTDAEFRSGSQISVTGGGVSIVEGTSFTTEQVDLTASTATQVCASDSTRKMATIQNNTGGDVFFGGSSVSETGANMGIRISAGDSFEWRNTAALYAYSATGGSGDNGTLVMKEF